MSPTQFAWRSLPAKDEPNLSDQLPLGQSCKQPKPSAETDAEMALRGWCGPDRGPQQRWP
jgi:hypothetical protein